MPHNYIKNGLLVAITMPRRIYILLVLRSTDDDTTQHGRMWVLLRRSGSLALGCISCAGNATSRPTGLITWLRGIFGIFGIVGLVYQSDEVAMHATVSW